MSNRDKRLSNHDRDPVKTRDVGRVVRVTTGGTVGDMSGLPSPVLMEVEGTSKAAMIAAIEAMWEAPEKHRQLGVDVSPSGRVDMTFEVDTAPVKDMVDEALTEVQFAGQLVKDVTRFLVHPDCRVNHPDSADDLLVEAVHVVDGAVVCDCVDLSTGLGVRHPFAKLWPAGPASDGQREIVKVMMRAMVEDVVGQLVDSGVLSKPDPDKLPAFPATGGVVKSGVDPAARGADRSVEHIIGGEQSETVHHLAVHPEYLINPDGTTSPSNIIDDA